MDPQDQVDGLGEDTRDIDSAHSPRAHTQVAPPSPRRLALDGQSRSAAGHAPTPPSRQPSPAVITSEASGLAQQPSFGGRLPSTPPLSRPPKFLTRPYRRTADGHHTHLHPFGSGSTSSGVRSAFKDFIIPAQIILLCSILNATWPLLTSTVTTVLEFLALVFASYIACARRSADCYFLEPVSHSHEDREGTIYVATIHWTLRALLVIGVASVVMFIGSRLAKLWRPAFTTEELFRAEYALGLDSSASAASSAPTSRLRFLRWLPIFRRFSGSKLADSSRPPRSRTSSTSSFSSPWFPSRSNPPTPSSLEAAQPSRLGKSPSPAASDSLLTSSSSKPHKSKSKAAKKSSNQPSADNVHSAGLDAKRSAKKQDSSSSLLSVSPDKDTSCIDRFHEGFEQKDDTATTNERKDDCLQDPSLSLKQPMSTSTMSLDRPSAAVSDEPAATAQLDCTQSAPNENQSEPSPSDLVEPVTNPLSASSDTRPTTGTDSDFISPHDKRRRRKAKTQKANRTTVAPESESATKQPSREAPTKSSLSSDVVEQEKGAKQGMQAALSIDTETSQPSISTTPQSTTKAGPKDRVTFSADTPSSPKLPASTHPLHALNSKSTIVRTKALHKRSQSAQLPSTMPWNNHSADGSGRRSGSPLFQTSCVEPSVQGNSRSTTDTLTFRRASAQTGPDAIKTSSADTNIHRWYSPFQSGLDISIEGESDMKDTLENRHVESNEAPSADSPTQSTTAGSRPVTTKLKLPPFLATPSSFFESSPRTPRIMPFSQNQQHPHPYGMLAGMSAEDSWTRTRSSSIGAPMTPQLDTMDPFDFTSGSKSAGCSRRNSIESNLMESMLSGKTRMFGHLDNDTALNGPSVPIQLTSPLGSSTTSASSSLGTLDFLSTMGSSTLMPLHVEALPDVLPAPASHESHDSDVPVFVNPWDTEDQYAVPATASPTAYLSSNLLSSGGYAPTGIDPAAAARQASLLRAMNGGALGGGTLANNLSVHPMVMTSESDPMAIPPIITPPRPVSSLLSSIPKFGPYPSVEMSLAAEVNKPPPLREIPLDDSFEKLSMEDVMKKKTGQEKKRSHRRTSSNNNNTMANNSSSHGHHGGSGGGHGSEQEDSKKAAPTKSHLQRTSRTGQGRSGHNKSASLGSFLPPLPPTSSDKTGSSPSTTPGAGDKRSSSFSSKSSGRDHHGQTREETSGKGGEHHAIRRTNQQTSSASSASGREASSKSLYKTRV
ncbi:hypothetical protein BGZ73_008156 [Actinomortierella ambigua]|nr:hypothetical protein BGZ73_008156 [Actinomortierella ambigua]